MSLIIHFSSSDPIKGRLRQMLDQLTNEGQMDQGTWSPSVDIYENRDSIVIVAELAGTNRDDVKIILDRDIVRIYGRREPTCCSGGAHFHRMEIASGDFVRSFRIGPAFISEKVRAQMEDGLLHVILPKAQIARSRQE